MQVQVLKTLSAFYSNFSAIRKSRACVPFLTEFIYIQTITDKGKQIIQIQEVRQKLKITN